MSTAIGRPHPADLKIVTPWDGDILNRHDGAETPEGLSIEVTGQVAPGAKVTVNGTPAETDGCEFRCRVTLRQRQNEIAALAKAAAGEWRDSITLLWDKGSQPRYRFSVDDNIEFLKDLGTAPQQYDSLFDHWYLAFWRRMHEQFGAKVHINIYYQTVARDFTIAGMPDKWRREWEANSDWLHLSFHALQNKPDRIYRDAAYEQIARDFELVMAEIERFAGEAVTSEETTLHWGAIPKDSCRALADRGIRTLIGAGHPAWYISDHVHTRDAWYEQDLDLKLVSIDAIVNNLQVGEVDAHLDQQASDPHTGELMELLIHEQYFRKELVHFQPDVQQKVVKSLEWVTRRGYQPVFWSEGFLGNQTKV